MLRVTIEGVEPAVEALRGSLDEHMRGEIVSLSDAIAHTAQQTHPWQNRTGALQAGTVGSNIVDGDLWNDSLQGEVLGDTEYGEFLEAKPQWAWLEPAWLVNEAFAEEDLDKTMQTAADESGW